ncbi:hypothetical protein [Salinispora sp. H7-4]|uniref:hypothetical protein n=1 Tax=Salinispora sp. H7-4 TaxID=2748321 RepID=UPI00037CDF49|nr:hypothetical protein [Salinispora sp. H7-4]NYT96361.1 hypothetical protein [Salinispora sp. H7-4]
MAFKLALGLALIIFGLVLRLFFPDTELLWFRGEPLGLVLILVGVIDVFQALRPRRRSKPKGILGELADDLGISSRDRRREDRPH